jgi:hypothetical protein
MIDNRTKINSQGYPVSGTGLREQNHSGSYGYRHVVAPNGEGKSKLAQAASG